MKKKTFIGLAIEGDEIRLSSLVKKGGRYVVTTVDSVSIVELKKSVGEKVEKVETQGAGDIFGIEEDETNDLDFLTEELQADQDHEDDEWGGGADPLTSDEDVLTKTIYDLDQVITKIGGSKYDVGLTIPTSGLTYDRISIPSDIKKTKDVRKYVEQKICGIYGYEYISEDHYRYFLYKNNEAFVTTYTTVPLLFELFERLYLLFPNKYFIRCIVPEDIALLRYLDREVTSEEDNTVFINLSNEGARIFFRKGKEFLSSMPLMSRPQSGKAYVNKVFSRLVMELEKGKLQYVTRFVVRDSTSDGEALADVLRANFEETKCDFIKAGNDIHINLPDVEPGTVQKPVSLLTISVGMFAAGSSTPEIAAHDYTPKTVLDRQKVFKLKWHGVVLLVLIALSPIVLNYIYQDMNRDVQELEAKVASNENQIQDLQIFRNAVLDLDTQNNQLLSQMEQIDRLGERSRIWTETLSIIARGLDDIPSTWLTSLQQSEQGFTLEGISMFRNRIPEVVEIFHLAGVRQVGQIQVRDRDFYRFVITISDIVEDESIFDPLPDENQEIPVAGGTQ